MKTIELQILILIFKITLLWPNDVNYDILKVSVSFSLLRSDNCAHKTEQHNPLIYETF